MKRIETVLGPVAPEKIGFTDYHDHLITIGGGEETAAILGIDPSLVDRSEIGGALQFKDLSENLKTTGFRSVEYKGVSVDILRSTPHVTDSGWIGPDHPSTATEEWGREMLETTANYIADFMEEFKKVTLS